MELLLNLVGLLLGVGSFAYAIVTNRQKALLNRQKALLQKYMRIELDDIEKKLVDVTNNAASAHRHIDVVRQFLNTVKRSDALASSLDGAAWAQADVTAAHRMLKNLQNDVASLRIKAVEGSLDDASESKVPSQ